MNKFKSLSLPAIHVGKIPQAFLNLAGSHGKGVVLADDKGGTKTNLDLFQIQDRDHVLLKQESPPPNSTNFCNNGHGVGASHQTG